MYMYTHIRTYAHAYMEFARLLHVGGACRALRPSNAQRLFYRLNCTDIESITLIQISVIHRDNSTYIIT